MHGLDLGGGGIAQGVNILLGSLEGCSQCGDLAVATHREHILLGG